MKKLVIVAAVLTMTGIACGSNDRVVRTTTERSYSSASAPLPPPLPLERERSTTRVEEREVLD